jgi:hypothetical protein
VGSQDAGPTSLFKPQPEPIRAQLQSCRNPPRRKALPLCRRRNDQIALFYAAPDIPLQRHHRQNASVKDQSHGAAVRGLRFRTISRISFAKSSSITGWGSRFATASASEIQRPLGSIRAANAIRMRESMRPALRSALSYASISCGYRSSIQECNSSHLLQRELPNRVFNLLHGTHIRTPRQKNKPPRTFSPHASTPDPDPPTPLRRQSNVQELLFQKPAAKAAQGFLKLLLHFRLFFAIQKEQDAGLRACVPPGQVLSLMRLSHP